jgi:hypothetical protein
MTAPADLPDVEREEPLYLWTNSGMESFHILRVDGSSVRINVQAQDAEDFYHMLTPVGKD